MDWFGGKARAAAKAKRLAVQKYEAAVGAAMDDAVVGSEESDHLAQLRQDLGLAEHDALSIYAEYGRSVMEARIMEALADGQLSPHEEIDLMDLAEALRIDPTFVVESRAELDHARDMWRLFNAPLATTPCSLGLQAGEACYYEGVTTAYEHRTKTTSVTYGGPVVSIPIMKGVRYRVGNIAGHRHKVEYAHSFGEGRTVVTDRRVLFVSPGRSITTRFANIVDIEPYSDGVKIIKASGKPLVLVSEHDGRRLAVVLIRAWQGA